jgi:cytochrome b561
VSCLKGIAVRRIYVALTGLMLLAVLAQFYFAAVGAFDKPQDDESFALHLTIGMMIIPVVSLARAPGRLIGLTVAPVGLIILQILITELGKNLGGSTDDHTTPAALAFLGLHAINGLFIMAVAGMAMRGARRFAAASRDVAPAGQSTL